MAAKGNSFVEVEKNFQGFITILTSAACEWFLICLLLVDGLLSYLLTKFASYCNLQKPCIFCSRFEHVTGNEKPQLYQDLLCSNHISELSSWIAYQIYGKDDRNGMCEDCIFSSPSKDKSNPEKHKISVGNSEWDLESPGVKRSMHKRGSAHSSVGVKPCSCCSRPYRPRENAPRLPRKSSGSKPNIPLPRFSSRTRAHRRDGSRKIRDKYSASVTPRRPGKVGWEPLSPGGYKPLKICSDTESVRRPGKIGRDPSSHKGHTKLKVSSDTDSAHHLGKLGWDPLSHVGYTELKISSDTDSEIPYSDDDPGSSFIIGHDHEPKKEGSVVQCAPEIPFKLNLPKLPKHSKVSSKQKPSLSDPFVQPDGSKASDVKSLGSNVAFANGLKSDESNFQNVSWKPTPSALDELLSLNVIPPPSNVIGKNVTRTSNFPHTATNKNDDLLKSISATGGASANTDPNITEPAVIKPDHTSVTVVSESAGIGNEGDSSGSVKEQPTMKEFDRVDGKLKPSDSQNSSAHGRNLSSPDTISGVNGFDDENQVTDASILNPKPMIPKSASVESGLGSLDEGYVSEIDGESIVDRLKRQVDYYRKCLKELFKELDEERNAAEIAANQAMAMITKLQEEKAAIHMEALQYLRMMEEQAEFDVDALEKANDLLAEKEKEIQDLEAELEFSKLDIPDDLTVQNLAGKNYDLRSDIDTVETTVVPNIKSDVEVTCDTVETAIVPSIKSDVEVTSSSVVTEVPEASKERLFSETTLLEFEDEKLYISNCLKSMERKLSEISCNGASSNMPNGEHSRKRTDDGPNQEETPRKGRILLNGQGEENFVPGQQDIHVSNGNTAGQEGPIHSDSLDFEEKDESDLHGQKELMDHTETELIVLENEISDLNDRLEALETDHDFLEHMVYSLQNGREGLRFVHEIAQQLRELRQIGNTVSCQLGSLTSNGPSQDTFEN